MAIYKNESIESISDDRLLKAFIAEIINDYERDKAKKYSEISEEAQVLWNEIEARLHASEVLNFDFNYFEYVMKENIAWYKKSLEESPNVSTSYHYGMARGLEKALSVAKNCLAPLKEGAES